MNELTVYNRSEQTLKGILGCIEACGGKLKEHAPATEAKNERPNHLVVID